MQEALRREGLQTALFVFVDFKKPHCSASLVELRLCRLSTSEFTLKDGNLHFLPSGSEFALDFRELAFHAHLFAKDSCDDFPRPFNGTLRFFASRLVGFFDGLQALRWKTRAARAP